MHGIRHSVGVHQSRPVPEFDLPARIRRWEAKARNRRELVAVPSNFINNPAALEVEQQFKKKAAQLALSLVKPGARVLDIGCGSGQFALHFIPGLLERGGSYVGIDQCQWTIDFAWQYLEKNGVIINGSSVTLKEGLASRLTWGRKTPFQREFDLIIDGQNLIHVVDDLELEYVVDEHCEVLKPNGNVFWYGPCTDLNFQYQGAGARKNEDTKIRSEREILNVFQPHRIIPQAGGSILHEPYFDEIYSFIIMQSTSACYQRSAE
jgi:2-polyprenyl-3-methyl-5-hydroxy-6-metoxy-1,4-benzoquinol methylase